MRVTDMQIEGAEARATLRRRDGEIRAQVVNAAGLREYKAGTRNEKEQATMAKALQYALDGFHGCAGDVASYRIAIEMLAD